MKKDKRWLFLLVIKSFSNRKLKTALLIISISISVVLVTLFLSLSGGVEREIGKSLRSFGANVLIEPVKMPEVTLGVETGEVGEEVYLEEDDVRKLIDRNRASVQTEAYELSVAGSINDRGLELLGLNFESIDEETWHLSGRLPESSDEMVAGAAAAGEHKLETGKEYTVKINGESRLIRLVGIVEPGTEEDKKIMLALPAVWEMTGLHGMYTKVLLGLDFAKTTSFAFRKQAENILPGAAVKTIEQVAELEKSLLDKITRLLFLVTLIVVFSTAIGVSSTYSTVTLERGVEIGLLKALGSTRANIALFFSLENVLISTASAVIGSGLGIAAAEAAAVTVFKVYISIPFIVFPAAFLVAVAISFVSTALAVKRAVELDAALTLKGL